MGLSYIAWQGENSRPQSAGFHSVAPYQCGPSGQSAYAPIADLSLWSVAPRNRSGPPAKLSVYLQCALHRIIQEGLDLAYEVIQMGQQEKMTCVI